MGQRGRGQRRGRLIEHGYDAPLKRIGGGELGRIERVGGHVDARCTIRPRCLGGLERGDGGADLRLVAVVLGRGAGITGDNRRQLERFRALRVRRQNGLFQRLASGGAHLMYGGETHATALIERHLKARSLKRRGTHAAHMLNHVRRLDGAGLGGLDGEARGGGGERGVVTAGERHGKRLDGEARGGGGERGVVTAGERHGKRLAQARHDGHIYGAAAQHIALERGAGGVDGTLTANHADAAASGMLRARDIR